MIASIFFDSIYLLCLTLRIILFSFSMQSMFSSDSWVAEQRTRTRDPFPYKPDLQFTNAIFHNIRRHYNKANMGQYFQLINIDEALYAMKSFLGARQGGGKLGEWFFGNDGEILMERLTVPKLKLPEDPLKGQYFTSVNRYAPQPYTALAINSDFFTDLAYILSPANFSSKSSTS